jgi:hypothetical protein
MQRTIPLRIHCLPVRDRSTRPPPQPIARAEPTQPGLRVLPEFSDLNWVAKNSRGGLGSQAISMQPSHQTFMCCTSLVAACSAILTLLSMLMVVKVSPGTAWSPATRSATPALEIVNRTAKGDRLPLLTVIRPHMARQFLENHATRNRAHAQHLTEGCESLVSELSQSLLAQIAGRCIS